MKYILWIYVWFLRPIISRILYHIFKLFIKKENLWDEIKTFSIENLSAILKNRRYYCDPCRGLLDYTLFNPNYFFCEDNNSNLLYGRDCDDFAHIWYLWATEHNINATKIYIVNGFNIQKSHVFTVLKRNDKYTLCDFTLKDDYENINDIINHYKDNYNYNNIIWCKGVNNGK